MLFLMSAAVAAGLWLPVAAQPAAPTANASNISFAQYRDWRNAFNLRRRDQLSRELAGANLPVARKSRLEQIKAYYDWLIGLPAAERDRRYRDRFDLIDTDHDGSIDAAERAAWRAKRDAYYRSAAARSPTGVRP
jgi:hypothetical protein